MVDPSDTATLPLPSPTRLRFRSDDRIYTAVLTQDLFDQWMVIQSWGGRHNQRGGGKTCHVDSFEDGLAMMQAITKRREKHGYVILRP